MAEKMSWCERFSKCPFFLKGYGSILGLKIAVTACIFMVLPTLFYLFYHEYRREGAEEFLAVLTYTPFWFINIGLFAAFMVLLSKIVILPLKRFERHISELENGAKKGPFELKRFDEIGYLVSRFNRLHRLTAEKIESKDIQLDVLHDFTKATSGVTDIPSLMDNFFKTLRTAIDFDIGAYMVCHNNHTEGRIYSSVGGLDETSVEGLSMELSSFQRRCCQSFGKDQTHRLQVSVLDNKPFRAWHANDKEARIDLPVTSFGKTVGIASIILRSDKERDKAVCSRVFGAMVQHAGIVMEKLLAHISAEEKKLSDILSSMSEGVYLIGKDGYATSVNKKGMELVGSLCHDSTECIKSGFYPNLGKCPATSGESCEFSLVLNRIRNHGCALDGKVHTEEIRSKDGRVLQLSISRLATDSDSNAGYVITVKDVTDDRLIQKRVMLSSKLAALGEMAAGIAHEVNNPLQIMLVNIELLDELSERGVKRIEHVKEGIFRIKGIVRDLLIFAREQTTHVEALEVNTALEKAVDIMRHQLKQSNVGIELDLGKQPLFVKCNKNLFQQVIINLLQNSKDAIEESARGTRVSIKTGSADGESVFVEVSDDGPGIPEKILDRIFDPFFTTKDVGKGTGLGLSLSRRIIEGMGGTITVESPNGKGTRFVITLSLKPDTPSEAHPSDALPDYGRLAGKSIIVADDEKELGRAIKDGIGPRVASVDLVHDGAIAWKRIMDRDYDIILLDIKMPGMNGMELYRNIKENKPYLAQNIIFLTGDTVTEETESFIKLTGCVSLAKPFTLGELLKSMSDYDQEAGV